MPRYEIVAHVTRELECANAEDAAAEFRRQLLGDAGRNDALLHLAVSPLPSSLRKSLMDFFASLERCASDAEEAFRGRVEAILMVPAPAAGNEGGAPEVPVDGSRPA
jgi:hypothetical protein